MPRGGGATCIKTYVITLDRGIWKRTQISERYRRENISFSECPPPKKTLISEQITQCRWETSLDLDSSLWSGKLLCKILKDKHENWKIQNQWKIWKIYPNKLWLGLVISWKHTLFMINTQNVPPYLRTAQIWAYILKSHPFLWFCGQACLQMWSNWPPRDILAPTGGRAGLVAPPPQSCRSSYAYVIVKRVIPRILIAPGIARACSVLRFWWILWFRVFVCGFANRKPCYGGKIFWPWQWRHC